MAYAVVSRHSKLFRQPRTVYKYCMNVLLHCLYVNVFTCVQPMDLCGLLYSTKGIDAVVLNKDYSLCV